MDEDGAYGSDDDDDDDDVEQEIDSPEETYDYGKSDEDADSQAESHPSGIGSDQSAPETDDSGDVFEYGNSEGQLNSNVKVEAFLRNHRAALEENQDLQRDWHPDAIDAYDELRALGTKPILPMDIREELETCPPGLFGVNPDCTINYHLDHWHGKRTTMSEYPPFPLT